LFLSKPKDAENLFQIENNILEEESLLEDDYIPTTAEEIVSRGDQIKEVAHNLSPLIRGGKPMNMCIEGSPGVGKTIVTRYVISVLKETLLGMGKNAYVDIIGINCKMALNIENVTYEMLEQISETKPKERAKAYYYFNEIWKAINTKAKNFDSYIILIFLDEIDALQDREVHDLLYAISRATSTQKITANNVKFGIILATNERDYPYDHMDDDVISSARLKPLVFLDYNAKDLYQILLTRIKAFKEDAMPDDLLCYCSQIVADKYHGDARYVIDLIHQAALIAIDKEEYVITQVDIEEAEISLNKKNVLESLNYLIYHDKLIVLAVYTVNSIIANNKINAVILGGVVTEVYTKICNIIGEKSNHSNHVSTRFVTLTKKKFFIVEKRRGYGNNRVITVLLDVESVIDELFDEKIKQLILSNYANFESLVISRIRRQNYKIQH
jgi:archaeal cell division control protein 6